MNGPVHNGALLPAEDADSHAEARWLYRRLRKGESLARAETRILRSYVEEPLDTVDPMRNEFRA